VEFLELFKLSGWKNQAEVARKLYLTPGSVSEIFSGVKNPGPRLVKYFRLVLFHEQPELLGRAGSMHEAPALGDLEVWRGRAKSAEKKLENLRGLLRRGLEESAPGQVISSNEAAEVDRLTEEALSKAEEEALHEDARSPDTSKSDSTGGRGSYKTGGVGQGRGGKGAGQGKHPK